MLTPPLLAIVALLSGAPDLTHRTPAQLVQMLAGPNADAAEIRLGETHATSLHALTAGLRDKNKHVRYRCADLLYRIGDSKAGPALIAALKDPDENARIKCLDALSLITYVPATRFIFRMMADPSPQVREFAALSLNGMPDGTRYLLRAAKSPSSIMRAAVFKTYDPDIEALPAIKKLFDDPSPSVRAAAVDAQTFQNVASEEAVIEKVSDPAPEVRAATAPQLSATNAPWADPYLIR